jgi:hypothetical protein
MRRHRSMFMVLGVTLVLASTIGGVVELVSGSPASAASSTTCSTISGVGGYPSGAAWVSLSNCTATTTDGYGTFNLEGGASSKIFWHNGGTTKYKDAQYVPPSFSCPSGEDALEFTATVKSSTGAAGAITGTITIPLCTLAASPYDIEVMPAGDVGTF